MSTTLKYLEDHTILYTNSTAAKSSGDIVQFVSAQIPAILKADVSTTGTVAAYIRGVHTLAKGTGTGLAQGELCYWHTDEVTGASTNGHYLGYCVTAVATTGATCDILLVPRGSVA
jgi:predicted RecA/RadA family phage recombinase